MPYDMEKVDNCWRVFNTETGMEHAKCTTKAKAEAQLRLLRGVEKGTFKPTGAPAKPKEGMSWREYYVQNTKGKKFSKENTLADHMKKLGAEYRKMKSK